MTSVKECKRVVRIRPVVHVIKINYMFLILIKDMSLTILVI